MIVQIFGIKEKLKWYLDAFAEKDDVFKEKYDTTEKTISGCANYITEFVRTAIQAAVSGSGMTKGGGQIDDDTVYQMAVEYFVDDAIVEKKPTKPTTDKPTEPKENKPKNKNKANKATKSNKTTKEAEKAVEKAKNGTDSEDAPHIMKLVQLELF